MSQKNLLERVRHSWEKNQSLLCVGLDSDFEKLPAICKQAKRPIFEFNKAIIDATGDIVCAFKPQIAFYSAYSAEEQLLDTIHYIHDRFPDVLVILDSKRGDIGNTAELYAREAFERFEADAVTVNPYLGFDSIEPFTRDASKGVFLLCRTSNPGARDLQDLLINGEPLYCHVAKKAVTEWNKNNNLMLVVGATYPKELAEIRSIVGEMPFLVPGIGAQGGSVEQAVTNGRTKDGTGMIINSSRQIIFAGSGDDFAEKARAAAITTRDEINRYRTR